MPIDSLPRMSKEPTTFFEALEILADHRGMLTNYKNLLRDSTYDLEETRKWAISLDKQVSSLYKENNSLKDEVEKLTNETILLKENSLNSARNILDKLDSWAIASYVTSITGNQEIYYKGTAWLKATLWKFLQHSGGRWPYANENARNLERIRSASRETLLEYLKMNPGWDAHIDQLQSDAEIVLSQTYHLPEWV